MKPVSNKIKYDFICSLLEEGDAMVCLDARSKGVSVPPEHKNNHSLNLVLNLNFKRRIEVTEEGVLATLAFGGRPFHCVIPLDAIWAAYDPGSGKGQIWGDSLPPEVMQKLEKEAAQNMRKEKTRKAPKLTSVPPMPKPGTSKSDTPTDPASQKEPRRKGHLRVIK